LRAVVPTLLAMASPGLGLSSQNASCGFWRIELIKFRIVHKLGAYTCQIRQKIALGLCYTVLQIRICIIVKLRMSNTQFDKIDNNLTMINKAVR
jgi:hypothetical protein